MAGLRLVTPPTVEPVTLDELKAHIRETGDDSDPLLTIYIQAAREYVEAATGISLLPQTWQATFDHDWPGRWWSGNAYQRIWLPKPPLKSVSSVKYLNPDTGLSQTLDAAQYQVVQLPLVSYIEPAYGVGTWPSVRDQPDTITVEFVAGYADAASAPAKIKLAVLMLAAHAYATREAVGPGGLSEVPLGVAALISSDRASVLT